MRFFLNFINIGVLGTWLLIIVTVGPQLDMNKTRIIVFFTSIIIVYFSIDIFKILLAKQLQSKLTTSRIFFIKRIIHIDYETINIFIVNCKINSPIYITPF